MSVVIYVIAGLFFAAATGIADGNAVYRSSLGWSRNPNSWLPVIHMNQLLASAGYFFVGVLLYHLYVGVMIQANVRSPLLQNLIWVTIMSIVVAYKDQVLFSWTLFEKGFAVVIFIQLILLLYFTGKHG